ncbi:MAG: 5'-methylthioadenosine/S-adenosylhomocysteine nucleosidase [Clostridia bacterium]
MKIGIIGAMEAEIKNIVSKLENVNIEVKTSMTFYQGKILDKEVVVCNCFEGKVNSAIGTQIMIAYYKVDQVINIGVAGTPSKEIGLLNIVISNSTVEFDQDTTALRI